MRNRAFRRAAILGGLLACTAAGANEPTAAMLAGPCTSCHGPSGISVGPATPTIAGMSPNYFITAMLAYKFDDDPDKIAEAVESDESLELVESFPRTSTIMNRIAKGYTVDQIKIMAKHFSEMKYVGHAQEHDTAKARKGARLHKAHCEKCHEDGGRVSEDDAGLLAGQWMPYLQYAMEDFHTGDREMPKKMAKEVKEMVKRNGEDSFSDLVHFYGSEK